LAVGNGASNFDNVTFSGGGTTSFGATGTTAASGTVAVNGQATLALDGTTTWSAGLWLLGGGGPVPAATVSNDGALVITGDVSTSNQGGSPVLRNLAGGTITRSTSTGTASFTVGLENAGQVSVQTGTLSTSTVTQTGGAIDVATSSTFGANGAAIALNGGVLRGTGTVRGNVTNTGASVQPGASPGTLAIAGSYTQGAGGTLQVEVNGLTPGTQFDVLDVTGAVNPGRTVALVQGFAAQLGDSFQFLTSGSLAGQGATVTGGGLSGGRSYQLAYPASSPFGARLVVVGPGVPVNTSPPQITGTVRVGETLTCQPGTWTNNPTFAFQWLRDGQPIASATQSTYVSVSADATRELTCRVTATNASVSASADSNTVAVPALAPENTQRPTVDGTPAPGQELTCRNGTWTGAPDPIFAFQWLRDGQPISGAAAERLTVGNDDVTHALACRVTATNAGGSAGATSDAVSVPAVSPQNTRPPAITGTQTLTCDIGAWTGNPPPAFGIQWLRDGQPIPGATGAAYTPAAADAGRSLTCRVTATNAGASASATSAPRALPAATPAPSAVETRLADAPASQVAAAFDLPSARRCVSRRNFVIRLRPPRGVRIATAEVRVNNKKVRTRKVGG